MATSKQQDVDQLKQEGNDAVRAQNYQEAVIHYTHALKIDPHNHFLFSNRSFAFLKLQLYHFAIEDAKDAIKLQPNWPKGFYRKGEVESQVGLHSTALMSYRHALLLDTASVEAKEAVSRTNKEIAKIRKEQARQPWMFCGGAAIIGVLLVLADQFLTKEPSIQYSVVQLLLVVVFAGIGYGCLSVYRYIQDSQTSSLLELPVDLLKGPSLPPVISLGSTVIVITSRLIWMFGTVDIEMSGDKTEETSETETEKQTDTKRHRKGGVGAARQRYKKGKT